MPLYDYECVECGARFEVRRGMIEPDREPECPTCGEEKCQRVFSGFSLGGQTSSSSCSPTPARPFR